jgi:hypothetical protein
VIKNSGNVTLSQSSNDDKINDSFNEIRYLLSNEEEKQIKLSTLGSSTIYDNENKLNTSTIYKNPVFLDESNSLK